MKSTLFILAISVIALGNVDAKIYYVSPSGANTNSGLTLSLAWKTLTYAAGSSSPVIAGDTVYVKSGDYGAEKVVFQKSGTTAKPISFIGYKTTPGDVPPLLVNATNPYAAFLSTDMPTYNGGNRASGTAFECSKQKYLIFKNFQIQNYQNGFVAGGTTSDAGNLVLYNINAMSLGDLSASYSGEGILLGSMGTSFLNNNILENCMVVNAAAEDFGINGDNNTLKGCKAYCNENKTGNASSDYYIAICGNYNTITSCYIERATGLAHKGHGMGAKTNAEQVVDQKLNLPVINAQYNKFYYCTAKNMGESFYARHRNAQYNQFYHCKAIGTHTGTSGSSSGEGNGMVVRDGASNNTFDGCIAESCAAGIIFDDSVEDGDTGTNPSGHPGNNNKFINGLIYNCYIGIDFSMDGAVLSDAGDNTIANCTFYKTRYIYDAERHCSNMKYIGNIYYGCLPNTPGGYFTGGKYASDMLPNGTNTYFKNCDFINIQGGMPANFISNAIGSISKDPTFVDPSVSDFHLKPGSPCADASISLSNVAVDYDNTSRPQGGGYDMGAYEYTSNSLYATISSTNIKCNGEKNGSVVVTASNGKSPYTYSWSNGQTTSSCTGLSAGNYTITFSDATPSSKIYTVTVTEPLVNMNTVTSISNVSSTGGSDGKITIFSEGGTPGYTYLWTPSNQTTNIATGLSAGVYFLKVTDANGCIATRTLTVTEPGLSATISAINVKCNGEKNGSAVIIAGSGKAPYTYSWSNGQTTSSCTGLSAGNYTITFSDATPSSKIYTVTVTEPLVNMNTVTSISNVSSTGGSDGKITIFSEGGTPGYTYLWTPSNQTTNIATGLSAGDYCLKVTDVNGCVATRTLVVTEPGSAILSAAISSVSVKCNGEKNGSVTVTASGGKAPYSYLWSNGQTNNVLSGLSAGNYSITVSDATPSSKMYIVAITQPSALMITKIIVVNASSCALNDGSIDVVPSGGVGNYSYQWNTSPMQTVSIITGLSAGKYSGVISDANGCSIVTTATVTCSTPTGIIQSQNENALYIYPNPTSGILNVVMTENDNSVITILDLTGRELYKVNSTLEKTEIDMEGIVNGLYLLQVKNSKFVKAVRVILSR